MIIEWDKRLDDLGVTLSLTPNAKYKLVKAQYQDEVEAQGQHCIWFVRLDKDGKQVAANKCFMDWLGRNPKEDPASQAVLTPGGRANVPMYANLDITKKNGPYFGYVESEAASDVVRGMGLPEHHHVNFILTFREGIPPQTLEEAAIMCAKSVTWMPIFDGAALYKYAEANKLGQPQTDELHFMFEGKEYITQVFNRAILYCEKDKYNAMYIIPK